MHVAQFVHRYPPALGGAEAWAERLSRYLVSQGDRVTVWTTTALDLPAFTRHRYRELPAGDTQQDGVTVRRFSPSLRWPGRRYLLKAASRVPVGPWQAMTQPWAPVSLEMWREAARPPADLGVVHATAFPYAAIIQSGLRLARRAGVPFVVTPFLHLGDPDDPVDPIRRAYTTPHLRRLLVAADRVIVQTPTEADAIRRMGVRSDRVVLQGLGVDPAECTGGDRERTRAQWGIGRNEVVVGHLANLSAEKGTVELLAAAAGARVNGAPIRGVLAGPQMPSFERCWKSMEKQQWVTLLEAISEAEKRDFYAAIDVFVLPSRSDSFGLVFLEAWANGIPVIGYRAGGVVDVIRHEQDGLLVRCGDMEGLTEAIRRLAADAGLREKWGRAGRERLGREFRWEDKLRIAAEALTAFDSVIGAQSVERLGEPGA
jgi:glycosyltransferase involved in cell wall biosynthesis